ncbi:uncharacterized protein LOC105828493 [Monomorium pharaonis]|uniref:uncharacterized protein LOC105828493 n=1 Tax=Monomorium pharaonis TaxID=307658 RepID=UPI00063EE941|nr:uncharacterized protein LOC105828493 [Monomorium pharaonis]XP_036144511.1 uncharacterized protein LOC105828493 [Monomorium pharaonis]
MNGSKFLLCNIIVWLVTSTKLLTQAEERLNNSKISLSKTQRLKIFPVIKFSVNNRAISSQMRIQDLLQETEVQARGKEKKTNPLQRIGFMLMMTPFIMQILSLPGAVATIKMSLLRSIMVAHLAIAILIYNFIKSLQKPDVVVVHQPNYHKHYSEGYPDNVEDEWFGR